MPIDNELYNQLSETWWDENEALGILRSWYNPIRFGYFQRILLETQGRDPQDNLLLDVGCGGGLLAEEFARLGCQVTGIDPSIQSLNTARTHAQQSGLHIIYQEGTGENLPFPDASFDLVTCCDVLEHVKNLDLVIQEISRVLKPEGLFFYDTINRTFLAWLATIKLAQEWKMTRFMPPNLHVWQMFIKPRELAGLLQNHGLPNQETKGMSPRTHPLVSISLFLRRKRGIITLSEMGKLMRLQESKDLSTSYMGYARKAPRRE